MEEPRRLKPEPPPLAAMKPHAAQLPQRTRGASAPENGAYWREAPNLPRYGKRSARRVKFSGGTSRFPRGPSRPNTLCYGTSQTCRGCRENFSLPGRGAAPHIPPINQLISQFPLCPLWFLVSFVVKISWQSCVRQHAQNLPKSAESAFSLFWQCWTPR